MDCSGDDPTLICAGAAQRAHAASKSSAHVRCRAMDLNGGRRLNNYEHGVNFGAFSLKKYELKKIAS